MSETTRRLHAEEARRSGALYRFRGASGVLHWIRGEAAYLAPNGAMSLLRRLGIKADWVSERTLTAGAIEDYRALIVPEATFLPADAGRALEGWCSTTGRWLVVSGRTTLSEDLLGTRRLGVEIPERFLGVDGHADDPGPVSAPGYGVQRVEAVGDGKAIAWLSELSQAERPLVWVAKPLGVPAVVATGRTLYFPFPFFGYVGAALQAHVCVEPIRGLLGSDGLFYIDRLAAWCFDVLTSHAPSPCWSVRLTPWGRHPSALVFRHDTDHSRDPSYLDYEAAERVPATYAVLLDDNRDSWLARLAPHRFLEGSFHYRTNREGRLMRLLYRPAGYLPDRRAITGRGLVRQARAARRAGIPIATVHRHAPFFYYPESVDALGALYTAFPDAIGSGSMFRWTMYRFSGAEDSQSYAVLHPDTSVPFWFPFKLVVAAVERHEILSGWESTHLLEPDPNLLERLFFHADAQIGGAYTLGYHPAHARRSTFVAGGNFPWFVWCVEEARRRGWWITTCADLYRRVAHWEALTVRVNGADAWVQNPTDHVFRDAVLLTSEGPRSFGDLQPGEERVLTW